MPKRKGPSAAEQFDERVARWMEIFAEGAGDAGWDDGSNINLVRNHIAFYAREIEREAEGQLFYEYPRFWGVPLPPEAPPNWMSAGSDGRVPLYRTEEELDRDDSWGRDAYEALCAMP